MAKIKTTISANRERALLLYDRLIQEYPDAECSLDHVKPLELVVATILSAQCTDARVNMISPALFARFPTADDYANASLKEIEKYIKTCGFYHNKAKNIRNMARALIERHDGEVPNTLEELTALDGVGRKTANVVLGAIFKIPGVVVDTHVKRLAFRLGWTEQTQPPKIEKELMERMPQSEWIFGAHALILHGRRVCKARKPACGDCPMLAWCPRNGLQPLEEDDS